MSRATTGTCYNGECEGMHLPLEEKAEQATWPKPPHQKVIVTAGVSVKSIATLQQHANVLIHSVHSLFCSLTLVYSRAHVRVSHVLDHHPRHYLSVRSVCCLHCTCRTRGSPKLHATKSKCNTSFEAKHSFAVYM